MRMAEAYGPQAHEVIRKAQASREDRDRRAREKVVSRGSTAGKKDPRLSQAENTFTHGFGKAGKSNKEPWAGPPGGEIPARYSTKPTSPVGKGSRDSQRNSVQTSRVVGPQRKLNEKADATKNNYMAQSGTSLHKVKPKKGKQDPRTQLKRESAREQKL